MPFVTVEKPVPHVSLVVMNRPDRLNLQEAITARKQKRKPRYED